MAHFTVFDVETPNRHNDRMSEIGITLIEDGRITETRGFFIDPETFFDPFNTQLTGIGPDTVRGAPSFPALWPQLAPLFERGLIAAHNAVFDLGVLKNCLRAYGIEWRPYTRYVCTVQMGRRLMPGLPHRLDADCARYGIALNHHRAADDSRACAELLLRYLEAGAEVRQHIRTFSFTK